MKFVYFIEGVKSGNIKIGVSENPFFRLGQLRTGSSEVLGLIGCCPGSTRDEARIHAKFADSRLSGEWFRPNPELLAFIKSVVLTPEEFAALVIRNDNISRLRREGSAKITHADALEAETEDLVRKGALTPEPAEVA